MSAILRNFRIPVAIVAATTVLPAAAEASTVINISSSGTALAGSLSALNLVNVGLGPISQASGSASTGGQTYSNTNNFAGVQVAAPGLAGLLGATTTADVITTSASSTFPNTPTGAASASIADFNLGGLVSPTIATLLSSLSLTASTIGSTTTFDGTQFTGTSNLVGLGLSSALASSSAIANAGSSPAANTTLVSLAGIRVLLNEQLTGNSTTNGVNTQSLTTNAIHVYFNSFGANLLTGDLILGQSQVSVQSVQSAVPEPASWAMMIVGFGAMGGVLRASRRRPEGALAR